MNIYRLSYIYGFFSAGLLYFLLHRYFAASAVEAFLSEAAAPPQLRNQFDSKWDVSDLEIEEILRE